jgi:carbamoyl-phosphate synthase large subunit
MRKPRKSRVLFVGGGRRVSLANEFIARNADVYGYESSIDVPLADVAKEIVEGMDFDDPECGPDILEFAARRKITHIVPLMDEATVVCGDMEKCIGSPAAVAMLCHDKLHFANWMKEHHPDVYPAPRLTRYPKFAKPRFGHGSRGTKVLHRPETIEMSASWVIQDYLDGDEVSVDLFLGGGQCRGAVARSRDRVEGGEVIESTVLAPEASVNYLIDAAAVCADLGVVGPANVQFKGGKIIEVNPRFGGGSVLSIAAGLPLVALALGHNVDGPPWKIAPLTMRRYHAESFR